MLYSMIITKNADMNKRAMASDKVSVATACPVIEGSNDVNTNKPGTTGIISLLERAIFVRT